MLLLSGLSSPKALYRVSDTVKLYEKKTRDVVLMHTLKSIPPSLKEKKRYITFNVIGSTDQKTIHNAIESGIHNFLGEYIMAGAGITVHIENQQGIIKAHPEYLPHAITALSMIHHIYTDPVRISTITTSGILTKAKRRNT